MHRVEQWLFWKFGEVAVLLCKNILKFDHSALSTVLILALFVMALPNKCMKQSWTILTIEISPSIHWFLPGLFPARRWSFWMSHCTTYCARLSLVLCQAVVHVCSRPGVHPHSSHVLRETARELQQVSQHFEGKHVNGSLSEQQVALFSFTSYGND